MEVIQTVNVSATLRAMDAGAKVRFDSTVNETTLRNACVRLRTTGVGTWSVDKIGKDGHGEGKQDQQQIENAVFENTILLVHPFHLRFSMESVVSSRKMAMKLTIRSLPCYTTTQRTMAITTSASCQPSW